MNCNILKMNLNKNTIVRFYFLSPKTFFFPKVDNVGTLNKLNWALLISFYKSVPNDLILNQNYCVITFSVQSAYG